MSAALDYDVVIVGGGPAGLTAAEHVGRAGRRVLLLERELYGGNLKNVDRVGDVPGAELASELAERATAAGAQLREAEVTEIEVFSGTRWVGCDGGKGYSAAVVIVATGLRFRKLGVPGEDLLVGRGVIDCVPCDGGFFIGRPVVVFGSGDHALADAAYLARLGAHVTHLTEATARLDAILGTETVEAVAVTDLASGRGDTLPTAGVVIRAGSEPNTEFLEDVLDLDDAGLIVADAHREASAPHVLAAGDARSGSEPRVTAAIEDGAAAARRALELLSDSR